MLTTKQVFTTQTTSGSFPFSAPTPTVASDWENRKYEIGGMITHYQQRLWVICDQHGRDLREVLLADGQPQSINDGRQVMMAAIRCDLGKLASETCYTLEHAVLSSGIFSKIKASVVQMVGSRERRLLAVAEMHQKDLNEILGDRGITKARDWIAVYFRKNNYQFNEDSIRRYLGRAIMREALYSEMNALNRDIQKLLDTIDV